MLGPAHISFISDILNAIFDIYADKTFDYNHVFVNGDFIKILEQTVPLFSAKIKSLEKRNNMIKSRANEALLNLREFIKYKKSE